MLNRILLGPSQSVNSIRKFAATSSNRKDGKLCACVKSDGALEEALCGKFAQILKLPIQLKQHCKSLKIAQRFVMSLGLSDYFVSNSVNVQIPVHCYQNVWHMIRLKAYLAFLFLQRYGLIDRCTVVSRKILKSRFFDKISFLKQILQITDIRRGQCKETFVAGYIFPVIKY